MLVQSVHQPTVVINRIQPSTIHDTYQIATTCFGTKLPSSVSLPAQSNIQVQHTKLAISSHSLQWLRFFFCGAATQRGSWPPHSWGFLDHTQRRTTVGRTPLDEWSARRRDLYLTTHNTHNRQTSMPPVGFEITISAGERSQTYALDRAATGTGWLTFKNRASCI